MICLFGLFKTKTKPKVKEEHYMGLEEAIKNMNKDSMAIPSVEPQVKKEKDKENFDEMNK